MKNMTGNGPKHKKPAVPIAGIPITFHDVTLSQTNTFSISSNL